MNYPKRFQSSTKCPSSSGDFNNHLSQIHKSDQINLLKPLARQAHKNNNIFFYRNKKKFVEENIDLSIFKSKLYIEF